MHSFVLILAFLISFKDCIGLSGPTIPEICPKIISKTRWGGRVATEIAYAIIPVQYVVIHHTVTPTCNTEAECSELLANMQTFHMDQLKFHDIGYNFIVGGDGNIYEGAGWHKVGAHTRGYNSRSLGLAFMGNYSDQKPSEKMLTAAKNFLECAVQLGELDNRYKLIGALQVSATRSPGLALYHEIQEFPHFAAHPK